MATPVDIPTNSVGEGSINLLTRLNGRTNIKDLAHYLVNSKHCVDIKSFRLFSLFLCLLPSKHPLKSLLAGLDFVLVSPKLEKHRPRAVLPSGCSCFLQ